MALFSESWLRHALATTPVDRSLTLEAEIQWVSFAADGGTDVCLVEHHNEVMALSHSTTKVDSWPEVKNIDVEPPETPGELTEPDTQMLGVEMPLPLEEQRASEQQIGEYRALPQEMKVQR